MIIVHLPNSKLYRNYSDDNGNIIKKTSDDTIFCPRSETPAAAGSSTFRHSCPLSDHQWWQLLLFDFRVKCSTLPKISVPHIDVLVLQHFKFRQLPSKTFFSVCRYSSCFRRELKFLLLSRVLRRSGSRRHNPIVSSTARNKKLQRKKTLTLIFDNDHHQ